MTGRQRERGFTLTELLVAITILGIIIVVIGAMITTAFRTSTVVSAELQGSRAPKTVSRYWVPDVEQAEAVTPGADGGCGSGSTPVASLTSHLATSAFDRTDAGGDVGAPRTVTYWDAMPAQREQLVRWVCDLGVPQTSFVVVSDLKRPPTVMTSGGRSTISVTVPDNSRSNREYSFDVAGNSQIASAGTP